MHRRIGHDPHRPFLSSGSERDAKAAPPFTTAFHGTQQEEAQGSAILAAHVRSAGKAEKGPGIRGRLESHVGVP